MLEWAKKEVELACKKENPNRHDNEWDYGCACYESALKAFESLCNEGHSGFSIGVTKNILNRLIDGKPLTPIEDTEDTWRFSFEKKDGTKVYQCKRMSSLFKKIDKDGIVSYDETGRFVGVNIGSKTSYTSGFIRDIMNTIVDPITMPYMPKSKPYYVYTEDFLYDEKNGDFDTIAVHYYISPEGERKDLCIYLKETEKGFDQISFNEYAKRKEVYKKKKRGY